MTDHNYYYYYFVDEKLTRKIYQIEKGRTKRRNWNNYKKLKTDSNQMEAIAFIVCARVGRRNFV